MHSRPGLCHGPHCRCSLFNSCWRIHCVGIVCTWCLVGGQILLFYTARFALRHKVLAFCQRALLMIAFWLQPPVCCSALGRTRTNCVCVCRLHQHSFYVFSTVVKYWSVVAIRSFIVLLRCVEHACINLPIAQYLFSLLCCCVTNPASFHGIITYRLTCSSHSVIFLYSEGFKQQQHTLGFLQARWTLELSLSVCLYVFAELLLDKDQLVTHHIKSAAKNEHITQTSVYSFPSAFPVLVCLCVQQTVRPLTKSHFAFRELLSRSRPWYPRAVNRPPKVTGHPDWANYREKKKKVKPLLVFEMGGNGSQRQPVKLLKLWEKEPAVFCQRVLANELTLPSAELASE